ncbi:MAG: DUF2076 family protein [Burkholderiales bacterium]
MNPVDRIHLDLFLAELAHARVATKDRRAEEAILRALRSQPDACYLLVQRVLQLESALCALGSRIRRAEQAGPAAPAGAGAAPARAGARRPVNPWWSEPVAAFIGTAFLLRSVEYLFGDAGRGGPQVAPSP